MRTIFFAAQNKSRLLFLSNVICFRNKKKRSFGLTVGEEIEYSEAVEPDARNEAGKLVENLDATAAATRCGRLLVVAAASSSSSSCVADTRRVQQIEGGADDRVALRVQRSQLVAVRRRRIVLRRASVDRERQVCIFSSNANDMITIIVDCRLVSANMMISAAKTVAHLYVAAALQTNVNILFSFETSKKFAPQKA